MTNYKLKGHEKFIVREGWLSKGLIGVEGDNRIFSGIESTDKLGVGINMVKSIHHWMQCFNLIEESSKTGTVLSSLGKIIVQKDKYLEDDFTLWILHSNIAKNALRATTWYLFFNKCPISEFTREEIFYPLKRELIVYANTDGFPDVSLRDDIDVLLNMYSKHTENDDPEDKNRSPFSSLGLLKKDNNVYIKQQPNLSRFSNYIILYELCCLFHIEDSIRKSVSIDEIAEIAYNLYNLTRVSINGILDKLDNEGYIRVDRTAGLDMIYPIKIMEPIKAVEENYI